MNTNYGIKIFQIASILLSLNILMDPQILLMSLNSGDPSNEEQKQLQDQILSQKQFFPFQRQSTQEKEIADVGKTKKIKKPKIKIQKKKGRPPKQTHPITEQQFFSQEIDDTENVKVIILKYLESIGLKKGLVFKQKVREKLRKEQRKELIKYEILWREKHYWGQQKEKEKIFQVFDSLKNILRKEELEHIVKRMLEISEILADECTLELYVFMKQIIKSLLNNSQVDAKQLFRKSIFLTGKFTTLFIRYEVEVIQETFVMGHFQQLVNAVGNQLKMIFSFLRH